MRKEVLWAIALAYVSTPAWAGAADRERIAAIASQFEPPVAAVGKLTIEDQRDPRDRKNHRLSIFRSDCENGVWNLGDESVAPDRLPRLEGALVQAFGDKIAGQDLVVRKYAVYLNRNRLESTSWFSVPMGASYGFAGAVAGALIESAIDHYKEGKPLTAKCSQSEMTAAWFDTRELENSFSPIIVEMDLTFSGSQYAIRSVYSPELESGDLFGRHRVDPAMAVFVQRAMNKANAALINEIGQRAPKLQRTDLAPEPAHTAEALGPARSQTDLRATLDARYAMLRTAMAAHDHAALSALLAPGFTSVDVAGNVETANNMIADLDALKPDPNKTSTTTLASVKQDGDMAMVDQRYEMRTLRTGPRGSSQRVDLVTRSSDMWVSQDGVWRLGRTVTTELTSSLDGKIVAHRVLR